MKADVCRHDQILKRHFEECGGYVFKTVGDAFCASFCTAADALKAALQAQAALTTESWHVLEGIRVRMALHTGTAEERDGDYFGPTLNRIARLISVGHGGQILVSLVTSELLRDVLPEKASLLNLGTHRLKDLMRPENVYQIVYPDLRSEFPPLKSLENHPNNLPPQPTPFIGREKELQAVRGLIRSDHLRVLSLTGVGGTGKTRLALQAVADLIDEFSDGIYFVDLSVIDSPLHIISAIARTLEIRETGGKPLIELVKDSIHEKRMLLLLDNFEHLMAGVPFVSELLTACPLLKLLVTSREALHLRGEQVFPVPPLSTPKVRAAKDMPLKRLRQYEAVSLFIDRAITARLDFAVTNENAPAVAEICARLDGLPLAVELAAARSNILSPHAILARLGSQLKLLGGSYSDLPLRQRTLRATIDWSYKLLNTAEQLIFREISVFSGGATLEGMEQVCACGAEEGIDVLHILASLAAKSLIWRDENAPDGQRFLMIASIREYGQELLKNSGAEREIGRAHASYFLDLAEKTEPNLSGPKQKAAFDMLETEYENFQVALEWLHANEDGESELRLCGALRLHWQVRGYLTEGREYCKRALTKGEGASPLARAGALLCAGALAREQGDYASSISLLEQAWEIFVRMNEPNGVARTCNELGIAYHRCGNEMKSREFYGQVMRLGKDVDPLQIALAENGLGVLEEKEGRFVEAQSYFEKSIRVFTQLGDNRLLAHAVMNLAYLYCSRRDYRKALELCAQASDLSQSIGDEPYMALTWNNRGFIHSLLGEHEQALVCYESLFRICMRTGNLRIRAVALSGLSEARLSIGDVETAFALAMEAYELGERLGPGMELGVSLRVLGESCLTLGKKKEAIEYFGRSIPLLERHMDMGETYDLERARKGLRMSMEGS